MNDINPLTTVLLIYLGLAVAVPVMLELVVSGYGMLTVMLTGWVIGIFPAMCYTIKKSL